MLRFSLFLGLLLPLMGFAETLNVDVSDSCRNELEKKFNGLNCDEVAPLEMEHLDENNKPWVIRFHFGFSRTTYHPTDMDIKSDLVTMKIDDVKMYERTSAHYYSPKNWDHAGEAFKWIDEPTNTMALSLEKGKNNFYVTVFHPKYLKSIIYNDSGSEVEYFEGVEDNRLNQPRPPGFKMLYLQNTHKNMVWQIGYGRQLKIVDHEKFGKLTYIPKVDIGISTGAARSVHIQEKVSGSGSDMVDTTEGHKVQGYNASLGHRLEYQKGKVSVFVDHKTIYNNMHHDFYDGTADYNLRMSPVTIGVGIDIFSGKHKQKKKN